MNMFPISFSLFLRLFILLSIHDSLWQRFSQFQGLWGKNNLFLSDLLSENYIGPVMGNSFLLVIPFPLLNKHNTAEVRLKCCTDHLPLSSTVKNVHIKWTRKELLKYITKFITFMKSGGLWPAQFSGAGQTQRREL